MKILIVVGIVLVVLAFMLTQHLRAAGDRVTNGLVALYEFTETEGDIIHDGTGSQDLTIRDPENFEWMNPGIKITAPTVAKTDDAKITYAPYVTIEAWVIPANNTQDGPARIVTFSKDSADRNFTLGQTGDKYNVRFRTSENPGNGSAPSISTHPDIKAAPSLQHVVYTRDEATGKARVYVDRSLCMEIMVPGDGSNWDLSYGFGMFNEINFPVDDRTWLGSVRLVALYDRVLSQDEINQNYYAGPPGDLPGNGTESVTVAWDANTEPDLAGYRIYVGLNPGDYIRMDDVGNVQEYTIRGLRPETTYYLAATAYDDDDNESAYSKELVHTTKKWDDPDSGKGLKHKPLSIEW